MKAQIYTMQTINEALAVINQGADHVGVTPGSFGLPGEVNLDVAISIVDAVRNKAVSVALTVDSGTRCYCRHGKVDSPRYLASLWIGEYAFPGDGRKTPGTTPRTKSHAGHLCSRA